MGLGPKGYPLLWKGEDLGLGPLGFSTHTRARTHCCHRLCHAESSRVVVVVVVVGAGASTKEIYFFLDPVIFRYYKDSWNFFTNEM